MLKGERVTLRAIEREDLPRITQFANDVEVVLAGDTEAPYPRSLDQTTAKHEEITKNATGNSNITFAIEADGKMIGDCGLWNFQEMHGTCTLGIGIGDKEYWGRGYGQEAIRLLLDWAFRLRNIRKVCLDTKSDNQRAIRCYLACGFIEEGRLRQQLWQAGEYIDLIYMGLLREDWK